MFSNARTLYNWMLDMEVADESFYSTLNTIHVSDDGNVVQNLKKKLNYNQAKIILSLAEFHNKTLPTALHLKEYLNYVSQRTSYCTCVVVVVKWLTILTFYSNNSRSDPTEVYSFYSENCFKIMKIN